MQRVIEEIDDVDDVFTYDTDLFAEAMKLSRPELYELAKSTNRRGISALRKYDLAVIVADAKTYRRDAQRKAAEVPLTAERVSGTAPGALTQPMLEALIVARATGHVAVEMSWRRTQGRVKSGTICALINRSMIVLKLGSSWQFELTKHGYRALCAAGFITDEVYQRALADLAEEVEQAHAEALDIDARQQEENERAAARDYAPSLAEQYAGTPARFNPEVIDAVHAQALRINAKFSPEFLKQQAENEQAYAGIKAREAAERPGVGDIITCPKDSRRMIVKSVQHNGVHVYPVGGSGHYATHVPFQQVTIVQRAEQPHTPDTWLQEGMILVGPQSGDLYRFLRWGKLAKTGPLYGAILRNLNTGIEVNIAQSQVVTWRYLPQASAEGVEQAIEARRLSNGDRVTRNRTGALGTVKAVSPDGVAHVTPDDPQDGVWRGLFSDFTRVSGPSGDTALTEQRYLVPSTIEAWRLYATRLKAARDAAASLDAELLATEGKLHALRCALAELVGRWQADGPLSERWSCGEALNDLLTDSR